MPIAIASSEPGAHQEHGVHHPVPQQLRDRLPAGEGPPPFERHHVLQVDEELLPDRQVQPERLLQPRLGGFVEGGADDLGGRVTRHHPEQDEEDDRHAQQREQCRQQAAHDVGRHGAVPWRRLGKGSAGRDASRVTAPARVQQLALRVPAVAGLRQDVARLLHVLGRHLHRGVVPELVGGRDDRGAGLGIAEQDQLRDHLARHHVVERLAEHRIVEGLDPVVVRQVVQAVAVIALGHHVLHRLQAVDQRRRQQVARAVAFALLDGRGECVMAAVHDADDAGALGRVEVLAEGADLQFRAAPPVVEA